MLNVFWLGEKTNENKNRTEEWLQALGLQLPSAVTKLGFMARIADLNSKVNRITEKNRIFATAGS